MRTQRWVNSAQSAGCDVNTVGLIRSRLSRVKHVQHHAPSSCSLSVPKLYKVVWSHKTRGGCSAGSYPTLAAATQGEHGYERCWNSRSCWFDHSNNTEQQLGCWSQTSAVRSETNTGSVVQSFLWTSGVCRSEWEAISHKIIDHFLGETWGRWRFSSLHSK